MSDEKMHNITAAKKYINIEQDSIYCVDKAYMSLPWLKQIDDKRAFFDTRLKKNADIIITG